MNAASDLGKRAGSEKGKGLFEVLYRELRLRNYSGKTYKAYRSHIRDFARYFAPKHPRELNDEDIKNYLLHLIQDRRLTAGTIGQIISALRFLYIVLYKRPLALDGVPRPLREVKLPVVLSMEEVKRLFEGLRNQKHKIMLMLVYSAGLRVGEVVRLKPEDIQGDRMMIHIRFDTHLRLICWNRGQILSSFRNCSVTVGFRRRRYIYM